MLCAVKGLLWCYFVVLLCVPLGCYLWCCFVPLKDYKHERLDDWEPCVGTWHTFVFLFLCVCGCLVRNCVWKGLLALKRAHTQTHAHAHTQKHTVFVCVVAWRVSVCGRDCIHTTRTHTDTHTHTNTRAHTNTRTHTYTQPPRLPAIQASLSLATQSAGAADPAQRTIRRRIHCRWALFSGKEGTHIPHQKTEESWKVGG